MEKPDTDTDLGKIAEEGLKQIRKNGYADAPGLRNPIALSVAFRKKSCSGGSRPHRNSHGFNQKSLGLLLLYTARTALYIM